MIKNYTDHAANERTYLAWIRTAIAVMAFGFVIEKFGIFLTYIGAELGGKAPPPASRDDARLLGIGLVVLGVIIIVVATLRFLSTRRQIDDEARHTVASAATGVLLTVLLGLLAMFLLLYLTRLTV
jgi:putative membrane protein